MAVSTKRRVKTSPKLRPIFASHSTDKNVVASAFSYGRINSQSEKSLVVKAELLAVEADRPSDTLKRRKSTAKDAAEGPLSASLRFKRATPINEIFFLSKDLQKLTLVKLLDPTPQCPKKYNISPI